MNGSIKETLEGGDTIFQNIMCVIKSCIIVIFMFIFNGGKRNPAVNYIGIMITSGLLTINVIITTYGKVFSEFTFFFDMIILLIFSAFILNFRWYLILTSMILCYVFLIVGNMFSVQFVHLCFNVQYADLIGTNNLYALITLILAKVLWIIFLSFPLYLRKQLNGRKMAILEGTILLIMGMETIICVTIFLVLIQNRNDIWANKFIIFVLFILVLDGCACWILALITKQKNRALQISYLEKHIKEQKDIYNDLLKNMDEIKKQKHNISNALLALQVLVEKKEYNSLSSAMHQIMSMFSESQQIDCSSDNNMWLAIIDHKKAVAERKNIYFEVNIEYGDYTNIQGIDACIVLGNLIDNAIEASEKESWNREIKIAIKNDFGMVYYRIENYISKSILQYNPSCNTSTKSDANMHGYGLKTVRELANMYGGAVKLSENNNFFCVEVLLYP